MEEDDFVVWNEDHQESWKRINRELEKLGDWFKKQPSINGYDLLDRVGAVLADWDSQWWQDSLKWHAENERLKGRIADLEKRFLLNSRNSHKPPSSEPFRKTRSLREKSDRSSGGQTGHKGSTLEMAGVPDRIELHRPNFCSGCGEKLRAVKEMGYRRRQVIDLEESGKKVVTEHRALTLKCNLCLRETGADFPQEVNTRIKYGPNMKATALYLMQYHMVPLARASQIFRDIWGVRLSQGTLYKFTQDIHRKLGKWEIKTKSELINSRVVNFDETGVNAAKKLQWVHTQCTETHTLLCLHEKRGQEAIDEIGVLPEMKGGIAVHDGMKAYFSYKNVVHGLCNAHHLRELIYCHEVDSFKWAEEFKGFLLEANKGKFKKRSLLQRYNGILRRAYKEMGSPKEWNERAWIPGKRAGHRKQEKRSKARCLLDRLRDFKKSVLLFRLRRGVPFTNNQAERDLRPVKVKQKISTHFRTTEGAKSFCRIYSFVSTARKQKLEPLRELAKAAA